MWDYSEPGAGESSEKKVKRCEMLKDFQLGLWVLEVTYHFNASSANIRSRSIYDCVGPENIQTPTTEGISLRTTPPPWIFHFCRELMAPHPSGISTSVTKTPQPLWKSSFSQRKTITIEGWSHLWLVCNRFHQKLVCFCFRLFERIRNIKTHYTPQSSLICNFCSSFTLNETDKVNKSVMFANLP